MTANDPKRTFMGEKDSPLNVLTAIFPGFQKVWEDSDFRSEDGIGTAHGVLAEFSHFYRDNFRSFGDGQLRQLSELINHWFDGVDDAMDNAVATCFLENVAGEACVEPLRHLLKDDALHFMRYWE